MISTFNKELPEFGHSPGMSSVAYLYNLAHESGAAVGNAILDSKDQLKEQGIIEVLHRIGNLKRRATQRGMRQPPIIHQYGKSRAKISENPVSNPSAGGYQP